MSVSVGVRRGDFDVIYVSGITVARIAQSEGIVRRWGIWYKANEGQLQVVPFMMFNIHPWAPPRRIPSVTRTPSYFLPHTCPDTSRLSPAPLPTSYLILVLTGPVCHPLPASVG